MLDLKDKTTKAIIGFGALAVILIICIIATLASRMNSNKVPPTQLPSQIGETTSPEAPQSGSEPEQPSESTEPTPEPKETPSEPSEAPVGEDEDNSGGADMTSEEILAAAKELLHTDDGGPDITEAVVNKMPASAIEEAKEGEENGLGMKAYEYAICKIVNSRIASTGENGASSSCTYDKAYTTADGFAAYRYDYKRVTSVSTIEAECIYVPECTNKVYITKVSDNGVDWLYDETTQNWLLQ